MARLTISTLGPLAVALDGEPVAGFEYNKVRALLVYLAVEERRPHTRDGLATLLWPGLPERAARGNLSQALTKLRLALGDKSASIPFLLGQPDSLQLNPDSEVEVDLTHFLSLLDTTEAHPHKSWRTCSPCADQLRQAVALYRGDFLTHFFLPDSAPFEEWADQWRQGLRQRLLTSLERLAGWAEWRGLIGQATEYVQRIVEMEPFLEVNQRALMRLLAMSGQKTAALAQYEQLRRLLAQEVAAGPDTETAALYEQIKTGQLSRQADGRSPAEASRLPSSPTRLIGREGDLQTVIQRVRDRDASAITLTGPPGIGKTRLALEIASAMKFEFENGAGFIELAPISEAALVPSAIAQALELKEQPGKPVDVTLKAALKKQHRLLVLDNFEHVLEGASFVADLLAACPALQVLVTSRAPLGIRAEQQYPLAPLALPDNAASLDVMAGSPAVQLFVERAQAARPDFALTVENAEAVAKICRRLDGLPLALELIAGRARALSPEELLKQLERGLEALTHGWRDLPERHLTLRSAIAWSYDRLSADEQRVFAHLGVFAGGCMAEAAQAVVGQGLDVRPALEALHESSLVQTQTVASETRFTLLETLREFALEKLATRGELDAAQRQHVEYFLALAEQAEPELIGPDQKVWFDRLEREHANLRAALTWSLSHSPEIGLRLATALELFWQVRGHLREGRGWLNEALKLTPHAALDLQARALMVAGRLAWRQGDLKEARALLTQSHRLFMELEDPGGLAEVLFSLGIAAVRQADYATAQSYLSESLSIARSLQERYTEAGALSGLGEVASRRGDKALARSFAEQALALHQARRDPRNTAGMMLNLGVTACEQREFEAARQYIESSLAVGRELGDHQLITISLLNLGDVLIAQDDAAAARGHLEEAIAIHRAQHGTETMPNALATLGRALLKLGDLAAARANQCEALILRVEAGERRGVASSLRNLAALEHARSRPERAARLLGAAEAIREAIGSPLIPSTLAEYEQLVADLRAALGESTFTQAWAEGRALTLEQAVQLALEPVPQSTVV